MRKNPNSIELFLDCLVQAEGNKQRAFEKIQRRSPFIVRSAVGATGSADMVGDFDRLLAGQYFLSLDHGQLGIFDSTKQFTRRAASNSPIFLGGGIQANVTAEGASIPVFKHAVDSFGLTPDKAAALAVSTKEAAQTPEGVAGLEAELRQAIMLAVDTKYLSILAADAGTTELASPDPLVDLQTMLLGVNQTGFGQLFWAVSPAVAVVLSTWRGTGDELVFPGMGPAGGELLNIPAITTAALTDSIVLLDATGICTGSEDLRIDVTESAMVEMDSEPGMNSVTPAGPRGEYVNLFQVDAIGILGIRTFAAKLIRPSAVAILEDISWSGMPTTTSTTSGV